MSFIPAMITKKINNDEKYVTTTDFVLSHGVIGIYSVIDGVYSWHIITQLFALQKLKKFSEVHLYVNSPGGCVDSAIAITNAMEQLKENNITVHTWCIGIAASAAAIIFAAGSVRHMFANTRIMLHNLSTTVAGELRSIQILASEATRVNAMLVETLVKYTGQPISKVQEALDGNRFFDANSAKHFGLVDEIITHGYNNRSSEMENIDKQGKNSTSLKINKIIINGG
jgi:ATP-dependent Clp protease protease subunit